MDTARWLLSGEPLASLGVGGRRGLLLLVGLGLLAAWIERPAAVFAIGAFLTLVGAGRAWASWSLRDLQAHHELLDARAFPGDTARLRLVAENGKLLPLSWVRARSAIPPALTPTGARLSWPGLDRGGYLQGLASLAPRGSAAWEFELPCRARGVHEIGPIELTSGDPFGFFARRTVQAEHCELVVYPRLVPLRRLGFALSAGLGSALQRRALEEDPSRTAGVRDYRPGDPLRRIHWKASARQGTLQVRIREPAAAPALLLALAAESFDFPWTRYREDMFELAASALASVAWRAIDDGWQVGLLASGASEAKLLPAAAPDQAAQIFEALARARPTAGRSIGALLAQHAASARRATVALAIGRAGPDLLQHLAQLQAARQPLVLLYAEEPAGLTAPLRGYRLRQWDDLATTLEGPGEVLGGR